MQAAYNCPTSVELLEDAIALWRDSSGNFPALGRQYSTTEQVERETLFDECLDRIQIAACQIPETESEREAVFEQITSELAQIATCAIDLHDPSVELLLRDGFSTVGTDLARCARNLDSCVSAADIFQACRNAWTACGLQLLLGRPMRLTPAIFAYSMLYPYTDNYLDEAAISREEKLEFSNRFRLRLSGNTSAPISALETAVWQLVSLIEHQYARAEYPRVYECLLAIHQAQEQSICQLQRYTSPDESKDDRDILKLTFTKGGTSVLADAYLAAGSLTEAEARFAFEWGVLLQLGDDLQDLELDLEHGALTLITQAAGSEPLDSLTNRIFDFAQRVMGQMDGLPAGSSILRELLKRSSRSLLIRAAAQAGEFYSRGYLAELETYSPIRFSFLKARQKQFIRRQAWFATFFEALILREEDVLLSTPISTNI